LQIFRGRKRGAPEDETRDELDEELRGKTALVTKDVVAAAGGEIKYRGSFWRAVASGLTGDGPIVAGTTVRIVGKASEDGLTLEVAPLENDAMRKE
jgi:membrane protein implicated in regulation of membrane protease activity